jgi:hypothetical protein
VSFRSVTSCWLFSPIATVEGNCGAGEVGHDRLIGWTSGMYRGDDRILIIVCLFSSVDETYVSPLCFNISSGMLLGREIGSDLSVLHVLMVDVFLRTFGLQFYQLA